MLELVLTVELASLTARLEQSARMTDTAKSTLESVSAAELALLFVLRLLSLRSNSSR